MTEDETMQPFEMMVGAILTQNSAWRNVELAIAALHNADLLHAERLLHTDAATLQQLIRPSGYFRQKAARLHRLAEFYCSFESVEMMRERAHLEMRSRLLSINGVGPETADSILLYALQRPSFVIDSYTKRLLSRLGVVDEAINYDALQQLFHRHLPADTTLFQEYHALIVIHAKQHCRKQPVCSGCPLQESLQCSYTDHAATARTCKELTD
ncbi:MAG: endonuclease III domain-containing protein [Mariprofundales bacterium]|nr:endonuclease III domain-containing protein [Mariprofundales bacterium]